MRLFPARAATSVDVPSTERLIYDAFIGYVSRMDGQWPKPMCEKYADLVASGSVKVIDDEAGIAGTLVLREQVDHLLVDVVAVRQDRRGSGVGKRLLLHAEDRASLAGFKEMRLVSAEVMTENIGLYGRCGGVEYHRAASTGRRRVYMRKRLRTPRCR